MSIRSKIVLVVLPLLIAPLVLSGIASSLSARNGITGVATDFLRFKAQELQKYALSQWDLLEKNGLTGRADLVSFAQGAVQSHAQTLLLSPTELVLAVDPRGHPVMSTDSVDPDQQEMDRLADLQAASTEGWVELRIGGVDRVAHAFAFDPFDWYVLVSEQRDAFFRTVNDIYWQVGLILAGSSVIAMLLLVLLSSYVTRPLRRMVSVIREIIADNDLSRRVELLYRDETGELAHTFNLMTGELEEAYEQIKAFALETVIAQKKEQKIRHVFQKYVPADVIDQYFRNPEAMLVGENRELVVLFSDIRSFTTISESLAPEKLVESLNSYFGRMVDIIMARRGIVDKYIGDAIMAFFGAPVGHPDDGIQAVQSALEMIDAVAEFNRQQLESGGPQFKTGIGINYGSVTVGNIGSERKMDYTVIGDMVNVASRIEGLTKRYGEPLIIS